MEAFQEKGALSPEFPFDIFIDETAMSFPPHWHENIEMIYVKSGRCKVGLKDQQYDLKKGDILLIGSGDIHSFLPRFGDSRKVFIQFGLSFFNDLSNLTNDGRFITPLLSRSHKIEANKADIIYKKLEEQVLIMLDEFKKKDQAYKLVLQARLYDIAAILLRNLPVQEYSLKEKNKQQEQLRRLHPLFDYVENNYEKDISLEKAAEIANYSLYHFSRFFKEATGITFGQYLEHFRIRKAEWRLVNEKSTITDIAYQVGFNSSKTFYRVFKKIKGCSPKEFKDSLIIK
ncbi:MAG: AraC family transcriptional regulator [Bacillota bacterium]